MGCYVLIAESNPNAFSQHGGIFSPSVFFVMHTACEQKLDGEKAEDKGGTKVSVNDKQECSCKVFEISCPTIQLLQVSN